MLLLLLLLRVARHLLLERVCALHSCWLWCEAILKAGRLWLLGLRLRLRLEAVGLAAET